MAEYLSGILSPARIPREIIGDDQGIMGDMARHRRLYYALFANILPGPGAFNTELWDLWPRLIFSRPDKPSPEYELRKQHTGRTLVPKVPCQGRVLLLAIQEGETSKGRAGRKRGRDGGRGGYLGIHFSLNGNYGEMAMIIRCSRSISIIV